MAVDDRFKVAVVGEQDGVNFVNLFYHQVQASPADDGEDDALLDWYESTLVPSLAMFTSETVTYTCITARKLQPAMTSTVTRFIDIPGDQTGDSLPGTVYAMIRYWCLPYGQGQWNHWKFGGIPESGQKAGLIIDGYVADFLPFRTLVTGGPFSEGVYTFTWIRSIPPGGAQVDDAPQIAATELVPQLKNLRSRQFTVCTG